MRQRTATLPPHCHYLPNFCALLNPRAKLLLPQPRLLLLSLTSVSKWPSHRPYNDELCSTGPANKAGSGQLHTLLTAITRQDLWVFLDDKT